MQLRMLIAPVLLAVAFSGSSCGQEQKEFGKLKVVTEEKSSGGWLGVSIQDMTSRLAR